MLNVTSILICRININQQHKKEEQNNDTHCVTNYLSTHFNRTLSVQPDTDRVSLVSHI